MKIRACDVIEEFIKYWVVTWIRCKNIKEKVSPGLCLTHFAHQKLKEIVSVEKHVYIPYGKMLKNVVMIFVAKTFAVIPFSLSVFSVAPSRGQSIKQHHDISSGGQFYRELAYPKQTSWQFGKQDIIGNAVGNFTIKNIKEVIQ